MRRTPLVVLLVGLLMLVGTATAGAAPPPAESTPMQCLEAFDDLDGDYVGEGWTGALVASNETSWFDDLWDDTDRNYDLRCGDEMSGVVHIGHLDTSGTGHAITPADEQGFVACWQATIAGGEATPNGPDRTKFTLQYRDGQYAIAYVDNARRFTYTLFTTGTNSHDWQPCFVRLM